MHAGEFLYFLDDDNALKPHALATLLRAAVASGAHILTTPNEKWPSLEPPPTADVYNTELWLPMGGSAALGIVRNCFGDAAALVSRAALEETSRASHASAHHGAHSLLRFCLRGDVRALHASAHHGAASFVHR